MKEKEKLTVVLGILFIILFLITGSIQGFFLELIFILLSSMIATAIMIWVTTDSAQNTDYVQKEIEK